MLAVELTVMFEPQWILKNQKNGASRVIGDIISMLGKNYADGRVFLIKKEFHQCRVVVACEKEIDIDELDVQIRDKIECVDDDTAMVIKIEKINESELGAVLEPVKNSLKGEEREFLEHSFGIGIQPDEDNEKNTQSKASPDSFIAIEPMKKWVEEIGLIASGFKDILKEADIVSSFAFLMAINRGNGLSSVLEIMADTLMEHGLFEFCGKVPVIEWKMSYVDEPGKFPSYEGLMQIISHCEAKGHFRGIVALDVEEWMDHLLDVRFDILLDFVWNHKDDIIFVMTIPYAEDDVINRLHSRINDIISVKTMKFVPPSDKQYFEYFCRILNKFGITPGEDCFCTFAGKLASEKNDGRFYGFNTVKKLADELLYKLLADAAKEKRDIPDTLSGEDIACCYGMEKTDTVSGIEALDGMVALYEVKNKVQEILSAIKLQREMYRSGTSPVKPCFHMMFTGNPGTGKTVVARIIGRIFREEGLLETGNFFEVTRKDFIGKFVGHTAPKTMEICRNAIGSVLFIDEAYMLADSRDGYSLEAIGTLIAEMENNRDRMVVIFAGYEKELEALFDMNPGLRDRIPHKINFPNYTKDELKKIFYMQFKDRMRYDESFKNRADIFFDEFPDEIMKMRDFSNGRFVRNLAERIVSKAALRFEMSGVAFEDFLLTDSDLEIAIADSDYKKLFSKKKESKTIGFNTGRD